MLAYHNIVRDDEPPAGERSLHLPLKLFREHLDALQRSHDVVSLPDLLVPTRRHRRPLVAITFDDAYRGCISLGLPELESRGLPATVFVAPGLLGNAACWWDQIAGSDSGSLDPQEREHLLSALKGDTGAVLAHARSRRIPIHECPPLYGIATEHELIDAAKRRGVRFGAHSWTHRNLAALDPHELATELAPSLEWLRERFPDMLPWLAFPYGLHSPTVVADALRAGYQGVLRISGGWVSDADVAAGNVPRLNVPSAISTDRFMLKTRGIVPI